MPFLGANMKPVSVLFLISEKDDIDNIKSYIKIIKEQTSAIISIGKVKIPNATENVLSKISSISADFVVIIGEDILSIIDKDRTIFLNKKISVFNDLIVLPLNAYVPPDKVTDGIVRVINKIKEKINES